MSDDVYTVRGAQVLIGRIMTECHRCTTDAERKEFMRRTMPRLKNIYGFLGDFTDDNDWDEDAYNL